MMSFLFSAFFAGVAGALYAHATFFISPTDFTWHKVVDMLLYTVFGGSNVMWGPLLGATVLTIVPESLRAMSEYRDIIYGLMLVILMDFRPDGILSYDAVKYISRRLKNRRKGASDRASGNENVVKKFGGITALSDISFNVEKGDIFGIIGPNGAGKTTISI